MNRCITTVVQLDMKLVIHLLLNVCQMVPGLHLHQLVAVSMKFNYLFFKYSIRESGLQEDMVIREQKIQRQTLKKKQHLLAVIQPKCTVAQLMMCPGNFSVNKSMSLVFGVKVKLDSQVDSKWFFKVTLSFSDLAMFFYIYG